MTESYSNLRPFLKTTEVAKIFCVNPSTVSLWVNSGKLKVKKTLGGRFRFPRDQVIKLWEQQQRSKSRGREKRKSTRYPVSYVVDLLPHKEYSAAEPPTYVPGRITDFSSNGMGLEIKSENGWDQELNYGQIRQVTVINKNNKIFKPHLLGEVRYYRKNEKKIKLGITI